MGWSRNRPRRWPLTRDVHFVIARELSIACNAIHNIWLLSGNVEGPARPHGETTQALRHLVKEFHDQFEEDCPGEWNPYTVVPC